MAIFKGAKNRDDTFVGTDAADTFLFDPTDLTSGDVIVGGGGRRGDTLQFTASGAIGQSALAGVSQIERIVLADGTNSIVLNDALVSTADGARVQVVGSDGDELVYAARLTGPNAIDYVAGAGADTVIGGAGSDSFSFAVSELDGSDTVVGGNGGGLDVLRLSGAGMIGAEQLAGVAGVEAITLGDGGVALTLSQSVAQSSETGGMLITGGAGDDVIDTRNVSAAESFVPAMTLFGGAGDDTIYGGAFGSFVDGGTGADTIVIARGGIVYDPNDLRESTGQGTLYIRQAATIDLRNYKDQSLDDTAIVQGFQDVDASASKEGVQLTGLQFGSLIGGSGRDTITGGSYIIGGQGADLLTGSATDYGTTFVLMQGDFARGEVIRGMATYGDTLEVNGSVDLRIGTVEGIGTLRIFAGDTADTSVRLSSAEAAALGSISGFASADQTISVHVQLARGDTLNPYLSTYGATLYVDCSDRADTLSLSGDVVVHGGDGNDVLSTSGSIYGSGLIYGDAGDDTIQGYVSGSAVLDGGTGVNTLILAGYASAPVEIDLLQKDQSVGDTTIIRNFENVDLSRYESGVTITGSNADNIIFGGVGNNEIYGSRGNDTLRGGGLDGTDILDGGAGDDLIYAGTGYYTTSHMTGGSGADTFSWGSRPDYYFDTIDTISDFNPGQDHLAFEKVNYGYAGGAFDTLVVATGTETNITGADLVIYRGGRIDNTYQLGEYLNNATGGGDHGLFIAALNTAGHTVVYYSTTANYGDEFSRTYVADLGDIGQLTNLTLSDFSFI